MFITRSQSFAAAVLMLLLTPVFAPAADPLEERGRDKPIYPPETVRRVAEEHAAHAAKYYGLDDDQREAVRALMQDGFREYLDWWETIDRQSIKNAKLIARGELTHNELCKQNEPLIQRSAQVLDRIRAELREHILDGVQRARFEEAELAGRDPLTGRQASFGSDARREDSVENASKRFTGKGFEEEAWAAWLKRVDTAARLNADQSARAADLLAQAKEAAADYRRAREADYKRLAGEWAEIDRTRAGGNADVSRWTAFRKAGAELTAPVGEIGRRWRADVMNLLDETQRRTVSRLDSAR